MFVRCVVTYGCIVFGGQGLLGFAFGQLGFSLASSVCYYGHFARHGLILKYCICGAISMRSVSSYFLLTKRPQPRGVLRGDLAHMDSLWELLPQRTPHAQGSSGSSSFAELWTLTIRFTTQSFEKLLLTEGEKIVLVSVQSDLDSTGIYGLVQALGQ